MLDYFFDSLDFLRGNARRVAALVLCVWIYVNPVGYTQAVTHWVKHSAQYQAVEKMLNDAVRQSK